jgi:hypothetical protein
MLVLLWANEPDLIIGPYVILIACAAILLAIAQEAARPIGTSIVSLEGKESALSE